MGRKVTDVAVASQNNAADATKLNIANADKVYAVHDIRVNRRNQYGDVVLVAPESLIPKWVEDKNGNIELQFTSTYVLDINRLLAVLHKEAGFSGYWEELKRDAAATAIAKANEALIDTFAGKKVEVDKDVKGVILQNTNAKASKDASDEMYAKLLKNIVLDGKFIPLEIDEEYTYENGIEHQYTDICTVAFDFAVRMSPALRKKLAEFIVDEVATEDWQ